MNPSRAVCLAIDRPRLVAQAKQFENQVIRSADDLILAFGRGVVASAPAADVPGTMVVRTGARPGFAVIGEFDEAAYRRVETLFEDLDEATTTLRYVSFERAARDVEVLAARLEQRFTATQIDQAAFQAIPRGGHIVLGLLALTMDLRHDQLQGAEDDPDRLVVLVDDCSLTGHRVRQTLDRSRSKWFALAVLYAPTELLRAVDELEDRIVGCVAAETLQDTGPQFQGRNYPAWQARWRELVGDDRYWVGMQESVAFAWKEPDRSFVNRHTGEREDGWQLLPHELCIARRVDAGSPTGSHGSLQLQHQRPGRGPARPADDVFVAQIGARTVLALPGIADALELDEVAGAMFRALHEHGTIEGAVTDLRRSYEVDTARLTSDVRTFVERLTELGMLVNEAEVSRAFGAASSEDHA